MAYKTPLAAAALALLAVATPPADAAAAGEDRATPARHLFDGPAESYGRWLLRERFGHLEGLYRDLHENEFYAEDLEPEPRYRRDPRAYEPYYDPYFDEPYLAPPPPRPYPL